MFSPLKTGVQPGSVPIVKAEPPSVDAAVEEDTSTHGDTCPSSDSEVSDSDRPSRTYKTEQGKVVFPELSKAGSANHTAGVMIYLNSAQKTLASLKFCRIKLLRPTISIQ